MVNRNALALLASKASKLVSKRADGLRALAPGTYKIDAIVRLRGTLTQGAPYAQDCTAKIDTADLAGRAILLAAKLGGCSVEEVAGELVRAVAEQSSGAATFRGIDYYRADEATAAQKAYATAWAKIASTTRKPFNGKSTVSGLSIEELEQGRDFDAR